MSHVRSETIVPTDDPDLLLRVFVDHLAADHDIDCAADASGAYSFAQGDFGAAFKVEQAALTVRIAGPSAEALIFLKDEIVKHIAEIDPVAAKAIRWSGEAGRPGALPPNFRVMTRIASRPVCPGLERVTLAHDDLQSFGSGGIHVRLMMPLHPTATPVWPRLGANGAPIWPEGDAKLHARTVTLRHVRPDAGEVDIDIACHEGGLLSEWALEGRLDHQVGVMGPAGGATIPNADQVFLAADLTGVASIARMIETLGDEASGDIVAAMPAEDAARYFPPTPLRIHGIAPGDDVAASVLQLAQRLTQKDRTTFAYFAGEFQTSQTLRRVFKDQLGLTHPDQLSVAYWREGAPGYAG